MQRRDSLMDGRGAGRVGEREAGSEIGEISIPDRWLGAVLFGGGGGLGDSRDRWWGDMSTWLRVNCNCAIPGIGLVGGSRGSFGGRRCGHVVVSARHAVLSRSSPSLISFGVQSCCVLGWVVVLLRGWYC